jgi:hypothetical protein
MRRQRVAHEAGKFNFVKTDSIVAQAKKARRFFGVRSAPAIVISTPSAKLSVNSGRNLSRRMPIRGEWL